MTRRNPRYGWVPDLPDRRDHRFRLHATPLPSSVDLRPSCPPVYDQGQLGSCTGNAIAAAVEFERLKQKLADFVPSRLFIYYNERAIEGTVNEDAGAMIRDGIKSVAKLGVCPEDEWPYDVSKFTVKPNAGCYSEAIKDRVVKYARVPQSLLEMKTCLAAGYPFVFGFTVYESFESAAVAESGMAPMPSTSEAVLGGHAVMAVGYDDAQQRFLVRNSWGAGWGMRGYFTLPYDYVTDSNLADDLWTLRLVSQ